MTAVTVTTRNEVAAFLRTAPGFPASALSDPAAAAAYLDQARSRVYPRTGAIRYPVDSVREVQVTSSVRVRTYVSRGSGSSPLLVYLHGGGWVMGNLDQHDLTCRFLSGRIGAAVVNVDYRLAPEHPYPAALDDCCRAIDWAVQNAVDLGADASRLVIVGSSAGAGLAAAVALRSRRGAAPPLAMQVLINPVLDSAMDTPSMAELASGYFLERDQIAFFWKCYLADGDPADPEASPARAESLAGLPAALVVTCELDPLRDEGEAYAHRLMAAGVAVDLIRVPGQVHGFLGMFDTFTEVEMRLTQVATKIAETVGR